MTSPARITWLAEVWAKAKVERRRMVLLVGDRHPYRRREVVVEDGLSGTWCDPGCLDSAVARQLEPGHQVAMVDLDVLDWWLQGHGQATDARVSAP